MKITQNQIYAWAIVLFFALMPHASAALAKQVSIEDIKNSLPPIVVPKELSARRVSKEGAKSMISLNLSHLGLTSLAGLTTIPDIETVEELYLNGNKISTLPPQFLAKAKALQVLHLEDNELSTIQDYAFIGAPNLRVIYLYNNNIDTIQRFAFTENPALQKLYLSANYLTEIPRNIFATSSNLQELDLDDNRIATVSNASFKGATNLQTLSLSGSQLTPATMLSITLEGIPALEYLRLGLKSGIPNDKDKEAITKKINAESKYAQVLFVP